MREPGRGTLRASPFPALSPERGWASDPSPGGLAGLRPHPAADTGGFLPHFSRSILKPWEPWCSLGGRALTAPPGGPGGERALPDPGGPAGPRVSV